MGTKTNYLEDAMMNWRFRGVAYTPPTNHAIGLFTAVADAEAGTITEVTGGSYARVNVAKGTGTWSAPSGGSISNSSSIQFPDPTANWGTITHFGIHDGTNWTDIAPLTASKTVNNGDQGPLFEAGALVITEDS